MSRPRRPQGRVPGTKNRLPKRNLIGPRAMLERLEAAGGVPEKVIEEIRGQAGARNESAASEFMRTVQEFAFSTAESLGAVRLPGTSNPTRAMALSLSLAHAMKESAPKERWCRHLRAADPRVTDIRSFALLTRGIWYCVECMKEAGPKALTANPWPNECDLCGVETMTFNEVARRIGGCMVNANVCSDCAEFVGLSSASASAS